jgi:cyclase
MLRARLIPCLLIHNKGLIKTVNFKADKYIGDPINAVRIFNEKEVDELMVLDIDATVNGLEPDMQMISNIASECRMPFCYGGGVKSVSQIERIINLGVEKIAISSAFIENKNLVSLSASRVGSQSLVGIIDIKKNSLNKNYEVVTHNGTRHTGLNPISFAKQLAESGIGEIVINSVDRDGMMSGYDNELVDLISNSINVPLTVIGGAGSHDDIRQLINRFGIIGAAAGSLFVFKGKYRAVLINYPGRAEKESLLLRQSFP